MIKVYGDLYSGNCYKVQLALAHLQIPYEWRHIDILKKESRTPEFLAKNPNGKIPVLELENGTFLAESNAILYYLADGTSLIANDRLGRAQSLQWLFFEQYSHEPYIAVARYIVHYLHRPPEQESLLQQKVAPGYAALQVMEQQLANRSYFINDQFGIADIALFAYTHVAHEGGFDLTPYRCVREWLARVQALPRHIPMGTAP